MLSSSIWQCADGVFVDLNEHDLFKQLLQRKHHLGLT